MNSPINLNPSSFVNPKFPHPMSALSLIGQDFDEGRGVGFLTTSG
jgi:hypothetical protein